MKNRYYFVYILWCENDTLYTGYTNNLKKRYQQHVAGTSSCKYTRSFRPKKLLHYWCLCSKRDALKLEKFIKTLTREEKELLISYSAAPF